MNKIIYIVLIAFFLSSCSTLNEKIEFKKPEIQIPKKEIVVKKNKGSLYSMRGTSLFADKKDLQIGDIIQININEGLKSNSKNKRELTSNRNNSLGGGLLTGTNTTAGANSLNRITKPLSAKFNSTVGVDFNTKSSSSDKGEVKTQFDETFSTTISAIIQETYANGNYYIKGSKELLIDGQKQTIIISGVIRPYDISSDNSISSSQIANLKILYDKEGEEAEVLDTPWGLRIFKILWPF